MISLTHRQSILMAFIRAERAEGREPSLAQMATAIGSKGKGSTCALLQRIRERGGKAALGPLLVRGPGGQRLQFIRVSDLPTSLEKGN